MALHDVLYIRLVAIIEPTLHPQKHPRHYGQRQHVTTLVEANLIDFVFTDMAARAEIEEDLQSTSHITPSQTRHYPAYESIVFVQRTKNTRQIERLIRRWIGHSDTVR